MRRSSTPALFDRAGRSFAESALELANASRAKPAVLPSRDELAPLVDEVLELLRSESPDLRLPDGKGRPGGLVTLPKLPTILVPDIHARPAFLSRLFAWTPPGLKNPVATLLSRGEMNLVCVGDVFHSEWGKARDRWIEAYGEYASGWVAHRAMDEEMSLSLGAVRIVLEAKRAFPRYFHYLKGNHDNIADEEGRGDHSFMKFVAEGEMVASWFFLSYGEVLLKRYRELELSLPLLVRGDRFVASHGEPAFALGIEDILEYRSRPDVVEALIWTPNDASEAGSVAKSIEALFGAGKAAGVLWFAGHRPVGGRYALRAGGRFVQFHNPGKHQVVYLLPGRDPDPKRDIYDIGG
jgi:hypothetical protein